MINLRFMFLIINVDTFEPDDGRRPLVDVSDTSFRRTNKEASQQKLFVCPPVKLNGRLTRELDTDGGGCVNRLPEL